MLGEMGEGEKGWRMERRMERRMEEWKGRMKEQTSQEEMASDSKRNGEDEMGIDLRKKILEACDVLASMTGAAKGDKVKGQEDSKSGTNPKKSKRCKRGEEVIGTISRILTDPAASDEKKRKQGMS